MRSCSLCAPILFAFSIIPREGPIIEALTQRQNMSELRGRSSRETESDVFVPQLSPHLRIMSGYGSVHVEQA